MGLSIIFLIIGLLFMVLAGILFFNVKSHLNQNGDATVKNLAPEINKRILLIPVFSVLASIFFVIAAILRSH